MFFVLSGFLITGLLLREVESTGRIDLIAFWGRRARRLLPAAAVVLVGTVVVGLMVADALDAQRFARDGLFTAVFAMNWRAAVSGISYLADPNPSPLLHYWSLGVEEQFYLLWPVLTLGAALFCRRRRRGFRTSMAGVAATATVLSCAIAVHQTYGLQPFAYFATYARVWQLGVGALLAICLTQLERLPAAALVVARWVGLAALFQFFVFTPADVVYPGWHALQPTLGAALVIAAGVSNRPSHPPAPGDVANRVLQSRPFQAVGRYSYGWYLWHWPPLVLLPLALSRSLTVVELLACAVTTYALAVVSFHVLEHPVRSSKWLAARGGRRSVRLGLALVAGAALACQSTYALAQHQATHTNVRTAAGVRLTPQPAAAAAQIPGPLADGCELGFATAKLSAECRYRADSGRGDVLLLGDSHAVQWFPAVDAIAADHHWGLRVWARAACPLADVSKVALGAPVKACDRWRDDVMQRAVAQRPSLVVVASLASYVSSLYDRDKHKVVGGAAARTLYQDGLERELKRLRKAGIPVLVIRDNPSFTIAGPACVLAHVKDLPACSSPLDLALKTDVDRRAAEAVSDVHVLDFTEDFCDDQRCYQVVGATLAYRDGNHLTAEMVTRLKPRLNKAAQKWIAAAGR